jgi:hypothetical protein
VGERRRKGKAVLAPVRRFVLNDLPGMNRVFSFPRKENHARIVLEADFSMKPGLPGYSSHQDSLTVRKEVSGIRLKLL